MSLQTASAKAIDARRMLEAKWQRLGDVWSDDVSKAFEEKHIVPLDHAVRATVRGMNDLREIVTKVRQACE